jgi:hypothetical protein
MRNYFGTIRVTDESHEKLISVQRGSLVDLMRNYFSTMKVTDGSHEKLFQCHDDRLWIS